MLAGDETEGASRVAARVATRAATAEDLSMADSELLSKLEQVVRFGVDGDRRDEGTCEV